MMKLIDSHCHLEKKYIEEDLINARNANIEYIINVAVNGKVDYSCKYDYIYETIGIHPLYIKDNDFNNLESFYHDKVVAIGETGLDLYKSNDLTNQCKMLEKHIELAYKLSLPMIFHTRNADKEIMPFIKRAYDNNITGILHSFTGSLELAKYAIEYGFYISFSGIITFHNVQNLLDIVKYVPLSSFLVETDAPYLSPIRGKRNHIANVRIIAEHISNIKQIPLVDICKSSYDNSIKVFQLEHVSRI